MNGEATTQYFNSERDTCQGDPVYLFILTKHPEIKDIEIFEHFFLYATYADAIAYLVEQAIAYLAELFNTFSVFFFRIETKSNKCKVAVIGALKGVQSVT